MPPWRLAAGSTRYGGGPRLWLRPSGSACPSCFWDGAWAQAEIEVREAVQAAGSKRTGPQLKPRKWLPQRNADKPKPHRLEGMTGGWIVPQ
jgi:hypothetical protein